MASFLQKTYMVCLDCVLLAWSSLLYIDCGIYHWIWKMVLLPGPTFLIVSHCLTTTIHFLLGFMKISDAFRRSFEPQCWQWPDTYRGCVRRRYKLASNPLPTKCIGHAWQPYLPLWIIRSCFVSVHRHLALHTLTRSLNRIVLGPPEAYARLGISWNMLISFFFFSFFIWAWFSVASPVSVICKYSKTSGVFGSKARPRLLCWYFGWVRSSNLSHFS